MLSYPQYTFIDYVTFKTKIQSTMPLVSGPRVVLFLNFRIRNNEFFFNVKLIRIPELYCQLSYNIRMKLFFFSYVNPIQNTTNSTAVE